MCNHEIRHLRAWARGEFSSACADVEKWCELVHRNISQDPLKNYKKTSRRIPNHSKFAVTRIDINLTAMFLFLIAVSNGSTLTCGLKNVPALALTKVSLAAWGEHELDTFWPMARIAVQTLWPVMDNFDRSSLSIDSFGANAGSKRMLWNVRHLQTLF